MKKIAIFGPTYLLLTSVLLAQSADIEVRLITGLPPITPPGSTGEIVFSVTNHGPDYLGDPGVGSFFVATQGIPLSLDPLGTPILFSGVSGDDCLASFSTPTPIPGNPPETYFTNQFTGIGPGEVRTCRSVYELNPDLPDDLVVHWSYRGGPLDDPNPANDGFTLTFIQTTPIPALNPFGATILVLTLLTVALFVLRRRPTRG